jgi:citrate synthase
MSETARIILDGTEYEFPVIQGSENEKAIDISKLRAQSGYITLDYGFKNTGSTQSAITYLDGENGILRYRGYAIEDLADKASFLEVAYLLIYGELPNEKQLTLLHRQHYAPHAVARKHEALFRSFSCRSASHGHAKFHDFKLEHFLSRITKSQSLSRRYRKDDPSIDCKIAHTRCASVQA